MELEVRRRVAGGEDQLLKIMKKGKRGWPPGRLGEGAPEEGWRGAHRSRGADVCRRDRQRCEPAGRRGGDHRRWAGACGWGSRSSIIAQAMQPAPLLARPTPPEVPGGAWATWAEPGRRAAGRGSRAEAGRRSHPPVQHIGRTRRPATRPTRRHRMTRRTSRSWSSTCPRSARRPGAMALTSADPWREPARTLEPGRPRPTPARTGAPGTLHIVSVLPPVRRPAPPAGRRRRPPRPRAAIRWSPSGPPAAPRIGHHRRPRPTGGLGEEPRTMLGCR